MIIVAKTSCLRKMFLILLLLYILCKFFMYIVESIGNLYLNTLKQMQQKAYC